MFEFITKSIGLTTENLAQAAAEGKLAKVLFLVTDCGVSGVVDINEKSPLYLAIENNHTEVADNLKIVCRDSVWGTAIKAVKENNLHVMKYLMEKSINANYWDNNPNPTVLQYAVRHGSIEMVQYLVQHGRGDIHTPRCWSEQQPDGRMVTYNESPLDMAKRLNRQEVIDYFEKKDSRIISQSELDKTSMLSAKELGATLQKDEKLLQKMIITGALAKRLEALPYNDSLSVYRQVCSKVDKKNQALYENIIRNKRDEGK